MDSKKYNNLKLYTGIGKGVVSFILLFLFLKMGLSAELDSLLSNYISNNYLRLLAFWGVLGLAGGVLSFPMNYYRGFYLEHKFNLSNQTFGGWVKENLKGLLVGVIIGVPILLLLYYFINSYGEIWWLPFAIGLFVISVILAKLVPVVILPFFYKLTSIEDKELVRRIEELGKDAGVRVKDVYRFNMSKDTKKGNAALTGLGRTKKIILGDTLLENYSHDEIETVIAHEFGHQKRKHLIKNVAVGTITSFLTFYLTAKLYSGSIGWFGFESITEVGAIPLISFWLIIIGVVQTPLGNILSRKFEYEADEYAIVVTRKPRVFIETLNKLTEQNLGDKKPHKLVEWYFYSHPSIYRRIEGIRESAAKHSISFDDYNPIPEV
jgi:STE24 endopeptidase